MTAARKTAVELPGYILTGKLGDGGMATVFKGVQESLKRPVAIKILKSNLKGHTEIRKRFERESLIIARLNHPSIINVIDQGITNEGLPYFIMNYVGGDTLEAAFKNGDLDHNGAIDVFVQVAKALAYAHKNQIIHCDIKPQNILVDAEGHVQVLDFGIAQIFKKMDGKKNPDEDFVMGSASYMAPEQRESAAKATKKSDLYALGVIMYQYFTGRLPLEGDFLPPSKINPAVNSELNALILSCLETNPHKRPKSADDLANELLLILQGKHIQTDQHTRASKGLSSNYSLLDVIKENKYGSVYMFQEESTGKFLVIKKKPLWSKGFDASEAISKIDHPHIIKILGTSKNQRSFIIVSEYCAGGTLADRLSRPFSLVEFFPAACAICEALITAHDLKIYHGNLRPSNILYDDNGVIKVSDFGLDEHYDMPDDHDNWYSIENELAGEAFDIYSVGVIFHQMLTGELPKRKYQKFVPSESFNELPEEIQNILHRMLKLDPQKRFPNFFILLDELQSLMEGEETEVAEASGPTPAKPTQARNTNSPNRAKRKPKKPEPAQALDEPRNPKMFAFSLVILFFAAVSTQVMIFFPDLPNELVAVSGEVFLSAKERLIALLNK